MYFLILFFSWMSLDNSQFPLVNANTNETCRSIKAQQVKNKEFAYFDFRKVQKMIMFFPVIHQCRTINIWSIQWNSQQCINHEDLNGIKLDWWSGFSFLHFLHMQSQNMKSKLCTVYLCLCILCDITPHWQYLLTTKFNTQGMFRSPTTVFNRWNISRFRKIYCNSGWQCFFSF